MASERAQGQMERYAAACMAERILYHPHEGLPREIDALVERGLIANVGQVPVGEIHVTVLNDELLGIPSARMDVGADRVEVAEKVGTARVPRGIQRILQQDGDFLVLLIL